MKAHTNAKKNFTKVFEKNGWRPMRRADAVYDYQQLVGGLAEDLTLKVFDDLVKEGFIRRRGGWYELALCPCAAPKLAEPPKLVAPTPEDLEALRALIAAKFPRDGQSNPFHFCIVAGVNPEPGRVSDVRYAFREAVKDGLLEKLEDGEEYRWCGPVEPPAPAPRPATPPPPPGLGQVDGPTDLAPGDPLRRRRPWEPRLSAILARADAEELCREVVWRLAQGRIPGPCAEALVQALDFAPGTKGE